MSTRLYKVGDCFSFESEVYLIQRYINNKIRVLNLTNFNILDINLNGDVLSVYNDYKKIFNQVIIEKEDILNYRKNILLTEKEVKEDKNIFNKSFLLFNINSNNPKYKNSAIEYFQENIYKENFDNMLVGFLSLGFNNIFSSTFESFNENSKIEKKDIKIGTLFFDNLNKSFFQSKYKEDNNLDKNIWMVYSKTEEGFFAINLETLLVFHFDYSGKASHIVNDIDNRYSNPNKKYVIFKTCLEEINNIKSLDNLPIDLYFNIEEIDTNSIFYGLKLIDKIDLNKEDFVSYTSTQRLILKENIFKYLGTKEDYLRNFYINNLYSEYKKTMEEKESFLFTSFFYDRHFNSTEKISNRYFYEKYGFENYKKKYEIVENILLTKYHLLDFFNSNSLVFLNDTYKKMEDNFNTLEREEIRKILLKSFQLFNEEYKRNVVDLNELKSSILFIEKFYNSMFKTSIESFFEK